jgi:transposase
VIPDLKGIWGPGGKAWPNELCLGDAYVDRIESLRELIELYDREIDQCDARIHWRLKGDPRYEALQRIAGVGPVFAAVFIAEIGDVTRFPTPRHLCSWAGMTPRHRESDSHVHRGGITHQGSRLLRWAAVEAISADTSSPASPRSRTGSDNDAAATSVGSPPPATYSRSSTTRCATATSAASPPMTRREVGHGQRDPSKNRHDPSSVCGRRM